MKPFNCVETIAMLECKQISSNSFKNEITFKLFNYTYIDINVCKEITDISLLLLHRNAWNHLTEYKEMINSKKKYSNKIEMLKTI